MLADDTFPSVGKYGNLFSVIIAETSKGAALEVWRCCQDSVDYCFGGTLTNTTADRILAFLLNMPEGATLTQISSHFGRNKKSDELQRAITTLKDSGKARSESRKTGGRAADIWFAC